MSQKPIQPSRADFASFNDYFHAMVEYQLELSKQHLENVRLFLASNPDSRIFSRTKEHPVCNICTNSFECRLKRFSPGSREKICLILSRQAHAEQSAQYYSGTVRLPEERIVWRERLESFLQEHRQ